MLTLSNLSTSEGDIKIIQRSARPYRKIGIILLHDRYGERVDVIEQDKMWQSEAIILTIYTKWLAEDTNCSWVTLTDCFRQCGLDRLAYSIERNFGLPSPLLDAEGTVRVKITFQLSFRFVLETVPCVCRFWQPCRAVPFSFLHAESLQDCSKNCLA